MSSNNDTQNKTATAVKVYLQNYVRAETDFNMNQAINISKSIGKLGFLREITPVTSNEQTVVRMNRDTLYGLGVFDLNCPVTIELPPNGGRYLSLYALDNDQYSLALLHSTKTESANITFNYPKADNNKCPKHVHYQESLWRRTKHVNSETRYIYVIIRIFVDPSNQTDVLEVNRLQDAVKVTQVNIGEWIWPNWDLKSLVQVRNAVAKLESFIDQNAGSLFGRRNMVDPIVHLIATATGWGGNPSEEAVYNLIFPPNLTNLSDVYYIDIETPSSIPIKSNGFWSVTVYNSKSFLQFNDAASYSVNSVTAKRNDNGSIRIYFSNTHADYMKNWLYIFPGWNYVVRYYLPLKAKLNLPPLQLKK